MKNLLVSVALSVSLLVALNYASQVFAGETGIGSNKVNVGLTNRDGKKVNLSNITSGDITVLAFWAPESRSTSAEVEKLLRFAETQKARVSVVLVSRGKSAEEMENAITASRQLGVKSRVYFDPELSAVKALKVRSVPWFVPLGKGGSVLSSGFNSIDSKFRNKNAKEIVSELARGNHISFHEFIPVDNDENTRKLIGNAASNFKESTINGDAVSMNRYIGKKPVFLIFWRESCPHCRNEMPKLQKFYLEHKNKIDFEMVGMAITNSNEDDKKAQEFVVDQKITFPIVIDSGGKIAAAYKIRGVPAIIYVDIKGVVRETQVGETEQLEQLLLSFLTL